MITLMDRALKLCINVPAANVLIITVKVVNIIKKIIKSKINNYWFNLTTSRIKFRRNEPRLLPNEIISRVQHLR